MCTRSRSLKNLMAPEHLVTVDLLEFSACLTGLESLLHFLIHAGPEYTFAVDKLVLCFHS